MCRITDEHVKENLLRSVIVKTDILCNGGLPLSVTFDAVHHSTAIGSFVTGQSLFADINAVVLGAEIKAFAEEEVWQGLLSL